MKTTHDGLRAVHGGPWLASLLALLLMGPCLAQTASTPAALVTTPFVPDAQFLKEDPYRKTKQLVQLTGIQSVAELDTVRAAINDVVGFARLFGVAGSNLGNAVITGITPERMAEMRAARNTHRAVEAQSTTEGLRSLPLEPASGHMVQAMGQWSVESPQQLSVRVDFRQTHVELKPVKDPTARVYRLKFVRKGDRWLFDGSQPAA